jgi:lysophospholipase L1-like esterase
MTRPAAENQVDVFFHFLREFRLMRITYSSILAVALTAAACGGGGGGAGGGGSSDTSAQARTPEPAVTSPGTQQPKSTGGLIEYYGDSTVWGWKTNSSNSSTGDRVAVPAPAAFAQRLPTSPAYQVVNEGVSGSTACGLLRGEDGKHPAWDAQMTSSKAKWVIINHGINDREAYSVDAYKSCLQQLVRTAKGKGKEVILETPNPIVPASLANHAAAMRDVATQEGAKVIDQFSMLTTYLNGRNASEICPDGLHPKEEIYVMKGEFAAEVFTNLYP